MACRILLRALAGQFRRSADAEFISRRSPRMKAATRTVRRSSLIANSALAPVDIDLDDGIVSLDGRLGVCSPTATVPMSRGSPTPP